MLDELKKLCDDSSNEITRIKSVNQVNHGQGESIRKDGCASSKRH